MRDQDVKVGHRRGIPGRTIKPYLAMASATFNGVEVRAVADRGRGLVATRDIKAGETVLIDLPTLVVCNDIQQYCCTCLRGFSMPGMRLTTLAL